MKKYYTFIVALLICAVATAQTKPVSPADKTDTTIVEVKSDTIMHIGKVVVIKHGKKHTQMIIDVNIKKKKPSNVSTNWLIFDFGFSNYVDKTNYSNGSPYLIAKPGTPAIGGDDLKLMSGKSINVNIWFFMQRFNLYKNIINLKYGLGLELNNYRYNSSISYRYGGVIPYSNPAAVTNGPYIFRDSISFSKNKLAMDYLTVPFMLNFATNPRHPGKDLNVSVGVSAGYLYSQRNKQVSDERGKQKDKNDFDLEPFKLSYIGELGIGPVHLYGSYSPTSFYQKALDIRPYTVGVRFSTW